MGLTVGRRETGGKDYLAAPKRARAIWIADDKPAGLPYYGGQRRPWTSPPTQGQTPIARGRSPRGKGKLL